MVRNSVLAANMKELAPVKASLVIMLTSLKVLPGCWFFQIQIRVKDKLTEGQVLKGA